MGWKKNGPLLTVFLLASISLLIGHASYYLPFISDDALISLRYAKRLLGGYGLTWTDGYPVEGYSNLFWVLLVALMGLFGVDLIDAARILGMFGMTSVICLAVYWYIGHYDLPDIWFPLTVGVIFFVLAAPTAVWAIGGLEQPLYGALIAASIVCFFGLAEDGQIAKKKALYLSLVLGLLCITRPDGPIFTVAALTSYFSLIWLRKERHLFIHLPIILLFPILFYSAQLVFRYAYYGELVPNTALVKLNPSVNSTLFGIWYYVTGTFALAPFSLLAIVSLIITLIPLRKANKNIYLLSIFVLWSLYIVFIGGDIFPAYRHFVPLIVVYLFALIEGGHLVINRLQNVTAHQYKLTVLVVILVVTSFTWFIYNQFTNKENIRALLERWEWEGKETALLLKQAFLTQQPLIAVTAAGSLPYWSELPALDMLGLNDYYLPRNPPADLGSGFLGHELGSGEYVLKSNPDIIVFNVGSEPDFRSGKELEAMAEFHTIFVPIKVKAAKNKNPALIYFNKYSSKIGIQTSPSNIKIPGFLFSGEDTTAYLNEANQLVASVKSGHPIRLTIDAEADKEWEVKVNTPYPEKVNSELIHNGKSITVKLSSQSQDPIEIKTIDLIRNY